MHLMDIKSKFHENKDWNSESNIAFPAWSFHQEQVPRKQGLKLYDLREDPRPGQDIKSKFHENKDWN